MEWLLKNTPLLEVPGRRRFESASPPTIDEECSEVPCFKDLPRSSLERHLRKWLLPGECATQVIELTCDPIILFRLVDQH